MQIHKNDNVEVHIADGHKYALCDIKKGSTVIKYGQPIGHATEDIKKGELVHTHNLKTNLSERAEYTYTAPSPVEASASGLTFMGYPRKNGGVGIRNDVWILVTVGCVNKLAEQIAKRTGAKHFPHPYGCSQLGDDGEITQKILAGLVKHPNAGGVLVLGLGCENNNIEAFKRVLGAYDEERVLFLNAQEAEDELAEGIEMVKTLQRRCERDARVPFPLSRLCIGLKCGGSDGLSGITANPLVGRVCDRMTGLGGSCVLTEIPEAFGAEHLLMQRCVDEDTFLRLVTLVNDFKDYYTKSGQPVYENPSPGNKAGGITTLEEKSLGCVQKGGLSPVTDVLRYGESVKKSGLSVLEGPGNDIVAVTNLTAAGAHIILFTTGRGTPLGAPVPTVKIATNRALASKKPHWIDFDASVMLEGADPTDALLSYILRVAEGEQTKNEQNGFEEIAIFKSGVTL